MNSVMYLLDVKPSSDSVRSLSTPSRAKGSNCKGLLFALGIALGLLAFSVRGQVVINEIATSNATSVENGGKFPDWVELFNNSAFTENLGGMSLTFTNVDGTNVFVFPAGNSLESQKFLVVWFDNETNAPGIHSLYSLPARTGGGLTLLRTDFTFDNIRFGLQVTDLTIGRIPPNNTFQLNVPTPGLANVAQPVYNLGDMPPLRFNEWMATNSAGDDKDWVELYNTSTLPVQLDGLFFSDEVPTPNEKAMIPLSFIGGLSFIRFWCDGSPKKGADHLDIGGLSSTSGETLSIYRFDSVSYIPLERVVFSGGQQRDTSEGRLPDGSTNILRFAQNKDTPGASNFQPLSSVANVFINEILTHTDPPYEDAIELYNAGPTNVTIGDWWLSNRKDDAKKFRIPAGTQILAGGYKVFYEMVGSTGGFNTSGTGNAPDFRMNSANGDELYLATGDAAGNLTGYRRGIDFGAANNGVSFGRYVLSTGDSDITAMSAHTFGHDNPPNVFDFRLGTGVTNAYPRVGPVVVNEIMYKPPNINVTNDNSIDEYVELHNIATTNVALYSIQVSNAFAGGPDIRFTNSWKVDDAIKYTFPPLFTLPANGFLLLVNFDPVTNLTQLADFRAKFGVTNTFTNIFGPYGGKLKNSSASIKLYAPDNVQSTNHPDSGLVPFVLIDKVDYRDSAPWPTNSTADGGGSSLQRRHRAEYGNDPINWGILSPSPGRTNDFSRTNVYARIAASITVPNQVEIILTNAQIGQPYVIEYQYPLVGPNAWQYLTTLTSPYTGSATSHVDIIAPGGFYRVRTKTSP